MDYGNSHAFRLLLEQFAIVTMFFHHVFVDAICCCASLIFVIMGVRTVLYEDEAGPAKLSITCAACCLWAFYNIVLVYFLISMAGHLFTNSELPRKAQEQLLNNIREGVFIVDEKESNVEFMNTAAISLSKRLYMSYNSGQFRDKNIIDRNLRIFEPIDRQKLKQADHIAMI